MRFTLQIEKNFSNEEFNYLITESDRVRIQNAMAIPVADICVNNFGYDGQDRPLPWHPLSERYAHEKHHGDTTPTLELTGALKSSIQIDGSNPDYVRIYTDNPYALDHQWGLNGQWPRPFFPLLGDENDSELTLFAESEAVSAAEAELDRILSER